MNYREYLTGLSAAVLLTACTANGGSGSGGGGGGPGNGDGSGGECLLIDPLLGTCLLLGSATDLANFTCTQTPAAGSLVTPSSSGLACTVTDPLVEGCTVYDPQLAADANYDSFAVMENSVAALDPALAGFVSLTVDSGPIPAGRVAAFLVSLPGGMVVDASVLRSLSVSTSLGGTEQESTIYDGIAVDVLGLVGDSGKILLGFPNRLAYDQLTLTVDATLLSADVFSSVNVYEACTNAAPTSP